MSRKKRKKQHGINPATFLRSRLDTLLSSGSFSSKDEQAIEGDLDALGRNVKTGFLLQTLLHAYLTAPVESRARLDVVVPDWLRKRDKLAMLSKLVASHTLSGKLRQQALVWLQAAGKDTQSLASVEPNLFYQAHHIDDGSQASVAVFWHIDARKYRAQSMVFLIDYNPPWDGAVKDVFLTPRSRPRALVREFVKTSGYDMASFESINAEQVKIKILTALDCNQKSEIRLPRDLIINREPFVEHILSLPDGADTPRFSVDDFDRLAKQGKPPEGIMHFEQTVGRRVRMDDGKELLVMGSLDDLIDE